MTTWKSVVIGCAFMLFLFGVLWLGLTHSSNFSTIWAALGSVVGVVTGAIPSYFFKQETNKANAKTEIYAQNVPPAAIPDVHQQLRARNLL
jgi:hypothetical protein